MVHLLRKYQQTLLIGVTILILITFIWFWNGSQSGRAGLVGSPRLATIYGRAITQTDVDRVAREYQVANVLGLNEYVQAMVGHAENQEQAFENFLFNSYIFDHEADALQIFPTDAEVQEEEVNHVAGLQTDGQFDPKKLEAFVQNFLPSRGFNDSIIDELVRDQVRVKKVIALLGAGVGVTPAEVHNRYIATTEKMDLSVVRLKTSDIEKSISVTDDDIKKAYDQRKETYESEEQRKVAVASFELSDAQKALKGKDRTDALQALGTSAWNLAQALADKNANFNAEAQKQGAKLTTTGFFTAAQPDPAFASVPGVTTAAFKLSSQAPISDVVEGENGYYVLHLEGDVPGHQLSLAEAKPKIIEDLKKDRGTQLLQVASNDIRKKILADLSAGKSFDAAAKDAGVTAESVPPFSLGEAEKLDVPDLQSIVGSAISLNAGQAGEFVPTDTGAVLVYMNSRQPPDKANEAEDEDGAKTQLTRQREVTAFLEWMRLRKDAAKIQVVQRTAS